MCLSLEWAKSHSAFGTWVLCSHCEDLANTFGRGGCSVLSGFTEHCVPAVSPEATPKQGREKERLPSPEFQISTKARLLGGSGGASYGNDLGPWGSTYIWGTYE